MGLCFLKLGSPCILDPLVPPPTSTEEWVVSIWPPRYGYLPLILLCAGALSVARLVPRPSLLVLVPPVVWFVWQCLSAAQSTAPKLTALTLPHFAGCLGCYFVGVFALAHLKDWRWFAVPVVLAFVWMLRVGIQQQFGGLASTREFVSAYYSSDALPEDLIKRMKSGRVFATMFYPNAFAGVLIMLLPFCLAAIWELAKPLRLVSKLVIAGIVFVAAIACLIWSGSKAGWLIALGICAMAGWRLRVPTSWKLVALGIVLTAGLVAFGIRYAAFFEKGATSVVARFDYWSAAAKVAVSHPILGTGPGTFQSHYARLKRPEAEMTRLVHNDYLQQASDSGIVGCLGYLSWIIAVGLTALRRALTEGAIEAALALGIIGWFAQGFVEFGLYVPGLAWPGFLIAGALAAGSWNRVDKVTRDR